MMLEELRLVGCIGITDEAIRGLADGSCSASLQTLAITKGQHLAEALSLLPSSVDVLQYDATSPQEGTNNQEEALYAEIDDLAEEMSTKGAPSQMRDSVDNEIAEGSVVGQPTPSVASSTSGGKSKKGGGGGCVIS